MKNKTMSFVILKKIAKNQVEKQTIDIKNLFINQKNNNKQLQELLDYHIEYISQLNKKMIIGISIYEWKNYYQFISVLSMIIKKNRNILQKNENDIKKKLLDWSTNKIKLKMWESLIAKNKKHITKIKKNKQQITSDRCSQLKILYKESYRLC